MPYAQWILTQLGALVSDFVSSDGDTVAIGDGTVLAVGPFQNLRSYIGPRTQVVDLHGATVVPGLHDAHGHVLGYALSFAQANLVGARSEKEVVDRVGQFVADRPVDSPVVGRGWDQNVWDSAAFPTHHLLSARFPDRPVALKRIDGHAMWVNRWVLERVGIGRDTPDSAGGHVVRDAQGQPTGILIDAAMCAVEYLFPQPDDDEVLLWVAKGLKKLADLGLTTVCDMGIDPLSYRILRMLDERGELPLRVVGYLDAERYKDTPVLSYPPRATPSDPNARFRIAGVKFYQDGALGSRGAALCTCYDDDPSTTGLQFYDAKVLEHKLEAVMDAGYQPAIHAIGDQAVRVVLDVLTRLLATPGRRELRPRVEHAQIVSPEDVPRFAKLGVIASIQPRHAVSDRTWAGVRIGNKRMENAYLARTFVEAGAAIALGTDFPIEPPDPWLAWLAATQRVGEDGQPPGGFRAGERLTETQTLYGMTAGAATAARLPKLGVLSPGKWADLTIINVNPLKQRLDHSERWSVLGTMVAGRFVKRP